MSIIADETISTKSKIGYAILTRKAGRSATSAVRILSSSSLHEFKVSTM
jgi:hypothetical protein